MIAAAIVLSLSHSRDCKMSIRTVHRVALSAATLSFLVLASCSRKSGSNGNEGGATASAAGNLAVVTATDTGVHLPPSRPAPRDSNEAWLRMMTDHHQGFIAMADTARPKLDAAGKAAAAQMSAEQHAQQQRMMRMLLTRYKESITPTVLASNEPMIAAVAAATSSDADSVFYMQVIAHHQEGVQMTQQMLPQLSRETKQMATKSIAQQKKEISDLQKKMSHTH